MPQFKLFETIMPGCYEVQPIKRFDERGYFVKTFHNAEFSAFNLETHFTEEYYSWSHHNVIRGLHFQTPPNDHAKLVYCPVGEVTDVLLDLRVGSSMYGKIASFTLLESKANMLYIAPGLAHGFVVRSQQALMMYKVTSVYAPSSDEGICWDSIDFDWAVKTPIVSERDQQFQKLTGFKSPFTLKTRIEI